MYISGGENVYPAEVESALLRVPGIRDVAVVGVPDERWGEVGVAYVVLKDGAGTPTEPMFLRITSRMRGTCMMVPVSLMPRPLV